MPKYDVRVYLTVWELVSDIEADSPEEACEEAEHIVFLDPPMNYTSEIDGFLVDVVGDTSHLNSGFYDSDYKKER